MGSSSKRSRLGRLFLLTAALFAWGPSPAAETQAAASPDSSATAGDLLDQWSVAQTAALDGLEIIDIVK